MSAPRPGIRAALAAPFVVYLFILPFPGTVALRLLCLAAASIVAAILWRRLDPPRLPARAALTCWALVAAASVAYSFDPVYSAGEWKNEIGYALLVYVAFFAVSQGTRELRLVLIALAASTVVIGVWGGMNTLRFGFWQETAGHGGSGSIAAYSAAVAPVFAVAALTEPSRRLQWVAIAALVMTLAAAFAMQQRILWLVFVLQLFAGMALAHRAGLKRLSGRAVIWLVLVAVAVAGSAITVHQMSRRGLGTTVPLAQDARLSVWPAVARRIMERPLAGAGFGRQAMRKVHPDLVPADMPSVWHAHNTLLNAGISMGLPGIAALAWVFGALLVAYGRLLGDARAEVRWIGVTGVAIVIGVVTRNITNDFFVRDGALLFWALNGALLGAGLRMSGAPVKIK